MAAASRFTVKTIYSTSDLPRHRAIRVAVLTASISRLVWSQPGTEPVENIRCAVPTISYSTRAVAFGLPITVFAQSARAIARAYITPSPMGLASTRLYVAESQVARIWYWDLDGPGKIAANADGEFHSGKLLYGAPGYTLFDSMAVDGDGWVCQGTLIEGGVIQISPDGRMVDKLPLSDPMITNLCFGGPDHRTALITCSGTGHLIAVDWPRPGGRLAFPRIPH
jgi:hypothetical protein